MIMKDTTAVEFLAKSLKDFPHIKHSFRFRELVEQAKEMEKKQIIDAWMDDRFPLDKEWVQKCAEQYYNETYGGNK